MADRQVSCNCLAGDEGQREGRTETAVLRIEMMVFPFILVFIFATS